MRSTLQALRFVWANTVARPSEAHGAEIALALPDGRMGQADLYSPPGPAAGLIVLVHGMSRIGRRDPRMIRASRALTAAGFRVLAPRIPALEALDIGFGTVDTIADVLRAVHSRQDLSGGRPMGLFAVSTSAAMSFLASTRPGVAPMLSAICSLGTFSNAVRWTRFLMTRAGADDYARLLVFSNLLREIIGQKPSIDAALAVAIDDAWQHRQPPQLPAMLDTLSPEDRALVEEIVYDPAGWGRYGAQILAWMEPRFGPLDVEAQAGQMTVPTVLLHGAEDNVIPPEESQALHEALLRAGTPSRLVLTGLIDHGSAALGLRVLPDAVALIAGFRSFFARVTAGAT